MAGTRGNLRHNLLLLSVCIALGCPAFAGGPPRWDEIPPAQKYAKRHIVSGSQTQLSVDGLTVSAQRNQLSEAIMIEISVTNCTAGTIQVTPASYDLVFNRGAQDVRLAHLDSTRFPSNVRKPYPPLRSESLPYERVGMYHLFFAPDRYTAAEHSQRLTVTIDQWQLDFFSPVRGAVR